MNSFNRTLEKITLVGVAFLIVVVLGVAYLMFIDGNNVASFNNLPFPIDKHEYQPGERVFYNISFCKTRPIVAVVNWALINDAVTDIPERQGKSIDVGCKNVSSSLRIPEYAIEGDHYFKGTFQYQANPFRTITYDVETEHFNVTIPTQ